MIYLGTPGRMIGLKCPASQQVSSEDRFTFQTTLEGRRKAQVRPRGARTWALQTSDATSPEDAAKIAEFADGAWGLGPFWFLPAEATYANVLPPINQPFGGHIDGGPMTLAGGGIAPFSVERSEGSAGTLQFTGDDPPVIPGRSITGSVWLIGEGATCLLQFFDITDTVIGSASSPKTSGSDAGVRVHVTAMPPAGTAKVRITVRNGIRAARPSITYTDKVMPYAGGMGCPKAILHGMSNNLVMTGTLATYSGVGFQITEVD